ncbi:MAG TPA: hypothetical protein VN695_06705 [Streptosporangiaceae bacterium]|nr:hypothetical protein [Streptosporangiaceae bacterium]
MPESASSLDSAVPGGESLAGPAVAAGGSALASASGSAIEANESGDGQGAVTSLELAGADAGAAGLSVFGSDSTDAGADAAGATTVSSAATDVTAGDFVGLGKVAPDSSEPPVADLAVPASACAPSPFLLPGDGNLGLVVREAAMRAADAGGGVAPEADDLPGAGDLSEADVFSGTGVLPDADDSDRPFSRRCAVSSDFGEEPRASAGVKSDDLSLPSGLLPFLLSDSGLGSTLFRTTVSG